MRTHRGLLSCSFVVIVALLAWTVGPVHAQSGHGGGGHGGGGGTWHGGGGGWHGGGGWLGGWHGGWHGGWGGGVFIGGPFWYPWGWGYYPYPYGYPYPVYPPPAVESSPPVYVEPEPQPQQYWYYCESSQGYYPYVRECPGGWQQVLPQPSPPAQAPAPR